MILEEGCPIQAETARFDRHRTDVQPCNLEVGAKNGREKSWQIRGQTSVETVQSAVRRQSRTRA